MKTPNLLHQHTVPIDSLMPMDDAVTGQPVDEAIPGAVDAVVGTQAHSPAGPPVPPVDDSALPEGSQLAGYEVIGVIGRGGFGIVYLAFDNLLERHVAIKEYLPSSLGVRAPLSPCVTPRSHRTREAFGAGLRSFINEARLLARFDHPALVKVLRFWEGNGTAYMAMPYFQGPTLADELAALGRSPDEDELRRLLHPLLDGLAAMHAVNCFHRDVAPDNILLTDDGPMLLDFGAARRVIGNLTNDLSAVVKPGFSPIEQYAEDPSLKQGPWTDLYALAAVAYATVTGKPPQPSVDRLKDDRLTPLSDAARGRFSPALLAAIDGALALRPTDRPKNVAEFLARLDGQAAGQGPVDVPREPRFRMVLPDVDGRTEPALDEQATQSPDLAVVQSMAGPAHSGESEFELAADAAADTDRVPAPAPVGAIVTVDPAAAAEALPSWTRPKPARSRMPVYVLLGMSFVLVLGAVGYGLGSITPPPMVSRLRSSTTAPKSAPAPAIARTAPPSVPAASTRAPAVPQASTPPPPATQPKRVAASPAAVPPAPAAPTAAASLAPAASRTQTLVLQPHAQASTSAPPAAAPKSPGSASPDTVAVRHPTLAAPATATTTVPTPTTPAPPRSDGQGRAPTVATVPAAPSEAEAPAQPAKPEHVAQAAPGKGAANRTHCTEIIQSASLGPLDAGETAFLKRECHR